MHKSRVSYTAFSKNVSHTIVRMARMVILKPMKSNLLNVPQDETMQTNVDLSRNAKYSMSSELRTSTTLKI